MGLECNRLLTPVTKACSSTRFAALKRGRLAEAGNLRGWLRLVGADWD